MDNNPVEDQLRNLEFLSGIALRIQDDVYQLKSWITAQFGELYRTQHPAAVSLITLPPQPQPLFQVFQPASVMSMPVYQQYHQTQAHFGIGYGSHGQDIRIDSFYSIRGDHNYTQPQQQQGTDNFNFNNGLNNVGQNSTVVSAPSTSAFNDDTNGNGGSSNHNVIDDENENQMTNNMNASDSLIDIVGVSDISIEIEELDAETEMTGKTAASSSSASASTSKKAGYKRMEAKKHKMHSDIPNILKRIKVEDDVNNGALKASQSQNVMAAEGNSKSGSSSNDKDKTTSSRRKNRQPQKYDDGTVCTVCDKQFKSKSYLQQHLDIHEEFTYTCHLCNRTFTTKNSLNVHISTNHTNSKGSKGHDEKTVKCYEGECKLHFKTVKIMLTHFEEVHNGIECQYCREILFKRAMFNQHIREKHLVCCSIQFVTRAGLFTHRVKYHSKKKRSIVTATKPQATVAAAATQE